MNKAIVRKGFNMAFRSDGTSAYLAGLLEKKKLHLEEILAVTKKQTGMIREETTEELTGLIAQKQKEIDLINEIDE